jgi:anti-sigma factor RsiW
VSCQELVELVTDYFEGALTAAEREAVDAHLDLCPGCVTYLEQMRATIRVTRNLTAIEQRPEAVALLHVFRDWKASAG